MWYASVPSPEQSLLAASARRRVAALGILSRDRDTQPQVSSALLLRNITPGFSMALSGVCFLWPISDEFFTGHACDKSSFLVLLGLAWVVESAESPEPDCGGGVNPGLQDRICLGDSPGGYIYRLYLSSMHLVGAR